MTWAEFKFPPINLWNAWKTKDMQQALYNKKLEEYFYDTRS